MAGINIATMGAILMVVGIIGLVISVATIGGSAPWGSRNGESIAHPAELRK